MSPRTIYLSRLIGQFTLVSRDLNVTAAEITTVLGRAHRSGAWWPVAARCTAAVCSIARVSAS